MYAFWVLTDPDSIEWIDATYPPVFVTTSRRDYFYRANLNFVETLHDHGVRVDTHIEDEALHTWQQDSRHPASAEVYRKLQHFVGSVTGRALASAEA